MPSINDYILGILRLAGNSNYVLLREGENLSQPMTVREAAEYLYNGTKPAPKIMPSEKVTEKLDKAYSASVAKSAEEKSKARKSELSTRNFYVKGLLPALTLGVSDISTNGNIDKAAMVGVLPRMASRYFWPLALATGLWSYYASNNEPPAIWHDEATSSDNEAPSSSNADYSGYSSSTDYSGQSNYPEPNNEEPDEEKPDEKPKGRIKRKVEDKKKTIRDRVNNFKERSILGYPLRHPIGTGATLIAGNYFLLKPIRYYGEPIAHNIDLFISEDEPVYVPIGKLSKSVIDPKVKSELDSLNLVIDSIRNLTVPKSEPKKEEEPDSITNLLLGI